VAAAGAASADIPPAPHQIATVQDLEQLRADTAADQTGGTTSTGAQVNTVYQLTADIDLSGIANWAPIGDADHPFKGTFEGDGHTISGLQISSNAQDVGLFGVVEGAVDGLNLNLRGVTAQPTAGDGVTYVGAVAGRVGGQVTNTTVTGPGRVAASGSQAGATVDVGGLVGSFGTALSALPSGATPGLSGDTASVWTTAIGPFTASVGGLAGAVQQTGSVQEFVNTSAASGLVTGMAWGTGSVYAGGLIGYDDGVAVTNSHATGGLWAYDNVVAAGGLIGQSTSHANSVFASGTIGVVATGGDNIGVGGLIGIAGNPAKDDPNAVAIGPAWVDTAVEVNASATAIGAAGELVGQLARNAAAGDILIGADASLSAPTWTTGVAAGWAWPNSDVKRVVALPVNDTLPFFGSWVLGAGDPAVAVDSFRASTPSAGQTGVTVLSSAQLADPAVYTAAGYAFYATGAGTTLTQQTAVWWMPDGATHPYLRVGNIVRVVPSTTTVTLRGNAASSGLTPVFLDVNGATREAPGLTVTFQWASLSLNKYRLTFAEASNSAGGYQLFTPATAITVVTHAAKAGVAAQLRRASKASRA
jgi:hypothetical protein